MYCICNVLVYVLYVQCISRCIWNIYIYIFYIMYNLFSTVFMYDLCSVYIIDYNCMWVNLIIFQFPWNSQLSALLFTTGTFPGFGHVTSQMSHSQWSNEKDEKEGTCPNWKLVLCTLNKKRYMFLNSMVQKKHWKKHYSITTIGSMQIKTPNLMQFGPNNLLLEILLSRHHRGGAPWLQ